MLLEFNEFVVRCGHNLLNHQPEDSLQGRVDSAVTKTNVHFPTDVNLLWDSMRGLLLELPKACMAHEVKSGRKSKFWSPTLFIHHGIALTF
ncbi:MAG: hypothetical protein OXU68_07020 [Bacteroidota bacterium]|nr:hypothetical protein [Bacteroidota bacterium]